MTKVVTIDKFRLPGCRSLPMVEKIEYSMCMQHMDLRILLTSARHLIGVQGGNWVDGMIIPAGISEVKPLKASTPAETGDPRPTPGPYGFEVLAQPRADGPCARNRQQGFSLLETTLSTVILGAVLIGTLGSLSSAAIGQRSDSTRVVSQLLLSRVMEELRSTPPESLPGYDGNWLEEDGYRVEINVVPHAAGLLKLSLRVQHLAETGIETRGVLLVAGP